MGRKIKRVLAFVLAVVMVVTVTPHIDSGLSETQAETQAVTVVVGTTAWTDVLAAAKANPANVYPVRLETDIIRNYASEQMIYGNIELDLNGYSIYTLGSDAENVLTVTSGASLTLMDSTGNESELALSVGGGTEDAILNQGGTITVESGHYGVEGSGAAINNESGSLIIDGGTFYSNAGNAIKSGNSSGDTAACTINGGTFISKATVTAGATYATDADLATIQNVSGDIYINGGDFNAEHTSCIVINNSSTMHLTGGTFSSTDGYALAQKSSMPDFRAYVGFGLDDSGKRKIFSNYQTEQVEGADATSYTCIKGTTKMEKYGVYVYCYDSMYSFDRPDQAAETTLLGIIGLAPDSQNDGNGEVYGWSETQDFPSVEDFTDTNGCTYTLAGWFQTTSTSTPEVIHSLDQLTSLELPATVTEQINIEAVYDTTVTTEAQLRSALANEYVNTVKLGGAITIDTSALEGAQAIRLDCKSTLPGKTLDLNDCTVTYTGKYIGESSFISIQGDSPFTIKDTGVNQTGKMKSNLACVAYASSRFNLKITGGSYESGNGYPALILSNEANSQVELSGGTYVTTGKFEAIGTVEGVPEDTITGTSAIASDTAWENPSKILAEGYVFSDSSVREETINMQPYQSAMAKQVTVLSVDSLEHSVEVTPTGNLSLETSEYGYTPESGEVSISNQGTGDVKITDVSLSGADALDFVLAGVEEAATPMDLRAATSDSASWTVTPKSGLTDGNYAAVLSITYQPLGGNGTSMEPAVTVTKDVTFSVGKKQLTITAPTVNVEKVYDGNNEITEYTLGTLAGVVTDDDVQVNATVVYDDAEPGTGKTITVTYELSGTDSSKYIAPVQETYTTGVITQAEGTGSVIMNGWAEGETPSTPVVESETNGITDVTLYYKVKNSSDETYTQEVPTEKGTYIVKATFPATDYYNEVVKTVEFSITTLATPTEPYEISATTSSVGWYTSVVTITPADGYRISTERFGEYSDSLVINETREAFDVYLQSSTGAVTDAVRVNAIEMDLTAPTFDGETDGIAVSTSRWREFLSTITFQLFFTDTQQVTIGATDPESGIVKKEYLVSSQAMTIEELEASEDWIVLDGDSFNLTPEGAQENIIYARVTNGADWVNYVSSDGIVYDTQAPVLTGATDGETYYEDSLEVEIADDYLDTVTLDGEPVEVTGNSVSLTLPAGAESHVMEAEDKTGNTMTSTITVTSPWTEVEASDITFADAVYGYGSDEQVMTITNAGSNAITFTDATLDDAGAQFFDQQFSGETLNMDESSTTVYSIAPKAGLDSGVYEATLTLTYVVGEDVESATVTDTITKNISYTVNPCPLAVTPVVVTTEKTYDGSAEITGIPDAEIGGAVSGDDVRVQVTAAYDDANAGTGKRIVVAYALAGADKDNYSIALQSQTIENGIINRADGRAEVTLADWAEGEMANTPVAASSTNGTDQVSYTYKVADAGDDTYTKQVPTAMGQYVVRAIFAETGNYKEAEATDEFAITRISTPQTPYTITGTAGNNGWYTSAVTVTPADGYQISRQKDGTYTDELTLQTSQTAFDIYLKSATGAITNAIAVEGIQIDTSAPQITGAGDGIQMGEMSWNSFVTNISYELFLTEAENVTLHATDSDSTITSYEYLIAPGAMTMEELEQSSAWQSGDTFRLEGTQQENVIYARITNAAGLVSYLSSNGIVYDTQVPVVGTVTEGETYYANHLNVPISDDYLSEVTLDGEDITVTANSMTVEVQAREAEHTIVATDKVGNQTTRRFYVIAPWSDVQASDITFDDAVYGYAAVRKSMTISNAGSRTVTVTDVSLDDAGTGYFDQTIHSETLHYGESSSTIYSVAPKEGLKKGSYEALMTITYSIETEEGHVTATETKQLSFQVLGKPLTMEDATITTNKVYDGTADASVSVGKITGILDGDDVKCTAKAAYNSADAGEGKEIRITYLFDGSDVSNYILPDTMTRTAKGSITQAKGSAAVTQAGWAEGEKSAAPVVTSQTNDSTKAVFAYKKKGSSDETYSAAVPTQKGEYVLRTELPSNTNYTAVTKTTEFTITRISAPQTPYTLAGTAGSNGWYTSSVTVTAADGYTMSQTRDGDYGRTITLNKTTESFAIYLKSATGAITDAVNIPTVQIDTTNPSFEGETSGIAVHESRWKSVLSNITFGLFFTDTQVVDIHASDEESGVSGYEYLISATPLSLQELMGRTDWSAGARFNIAPGNMQENIIYARAVNAAGLVSYASSDGIVYDVQAPVITNLTDAETYYGEVPGVTVADDYLAEVILDGEQVAVDGTTVSLTLTAAEEPHVLEAVDKTGNRITYTVNVMETWVRDGIATSGTKRLTTGREYKLGGGQWTVSGDTTVYQGGTTFYATASGEFDFQQK